MKGTWWSRLALCLSGVSALHCCAIDSCPDGLNAALCELLARECRVQCAHGGGGGGGGGGARSGGVPAVLHQMWKTERIPRRYAAFVESWLALHPAWTYVFWTDADLERLVDHRASGLAGRDLRRDALSGVQRSDVARYAILYVFGGIYADLDMEALKPIDALLETTNRSVVLGQEPLAHAALLNDVARTTCNAIMASAPRAPFWKHVLRSLALGERGTERGPGGGPVDSTGPRMLERAVVSYEAAGAELVVLAPEALYPLWGPAAVRLVQTLCTDTQAVAHLPPHKRAACEDARSRGFTNAIRETSYAAHHWTHSWLGMVDERMTTDIRTIILAWERLPQATSQWTRPR